MQRVLLQRLRNIAFVPDLCVGHDHTHRHPCSKAGEWIIRISDIARMYSKSALSLCPVCEHRLSPIPAISDNPNLLLYRVRISDHTHAHARGMMCTSAAFLADRARAQISCFQSKVSTAAVKSPMRKLLSKLPSPPPPPPPRIPSSVFFILNCRRNEAIFFLVPSLSTTLRSAGHGNRRITNCCCVRMCGPSCNNM